MNKILYTILYGAQKQSLRMNEAVVQFIEDYIISVIEDSDTVPEDIDKVTDILRKILTALLKERDCSYTGYTTDDWFFMELFLGVGIRRIFESGDNRNMKVACVSYDSGKVVFVCVKLPSDLKVLPDTSKAVELAEKIISTCPPSRRLELPEDDMLAAILLSKEYWKGMS